MSEEFLSEDGQVLAIIRSDKELKRADRLEVIEFGIKTKHSQFSREEIDYIRTEALKGTQYKLIAENIGKKYTTVLNVIRGLGLPLRKVGKIVLTPRHEKELRKDLLRIKMTYEEIAKRHGMSVPSVKRFVNKWGLPGHYNHNHPTRQMLYALIKRLYVKEGLSTIQIAAKLKNRCMYHDDEFVRDVLIRLKVKRRRDRPKNLLYQYYRYKHLNQNSYWNGKKIIAYIKENYKHKTLKEMSDETGLDRKTIIRRVHLLGLTLSRIKSDRRIIYQKIAYEYTHNPQVTIKDLADKYGLSQNGTNYAMKRMGVKITIRRKGRQKRAEVKTDGL